MNFFVAYPALVITLPLAVGLMARWQFAPSDRKRTELLFVATVLVIPATAAAVWFAIALSAVRPLKYDAYVYTLDHIFGNPSFALGRIVYSHRGLFDLLCVTYELLPVAILGTFAAYVFLRSHAESLRVFWTFLLNLFLAVPIYLAFPVCGPLYAFPGFPFHAPEHLTPHLLALSAPPNGIPSVHTSTALLVLWFLWPWRSGKIIGIFFLALTILATLGSGQHYLFDLLCAVPYTAIVLWLGVKVRPKRMYGTPPLYDEAEAITVKNT